MIQCEERDLVGGLSQQVVIPIPPTPELLGFPPGRGLSVIAPPRASGRRKGNMHWLPSLLLGFVSLSSVTLPSPCNAHVLFRVTLSVAETFEMKSLVHGS